MLTPDISEIYPGTSGKTQGDRNESNPPAKAIKMLTRDTCIFSVSQQSPKPHGQIQIKPRQRRTAGECCKRDQQRRLPRAGKEIEVRLAKVASQGARRRRFDYSSRLGIDEK